ncbi:hypothetical protein HK101_003766 [Irineochytrium annulatum]|nr:hypothetical protein HK101_003766 [Irineochytrium annulatum]
MSPPEKPSKDLDPAGGFGGSTTTSVLSPSLTHFLALTEWSFVSLFLVFGLPNVFWLLAASFSVLSHPSTCSRSLPTFLISQLARHTLLLVPFVVIPGHLLVRIVAARLAIGEEKDIRDEDPDSVRSVWRSLGRRRSKEGDQSDWVSVSGMPLVRSMVMVWGPLLELFSLSAGIAILLQSTTCRASDPNLWNFTLVHILLANKLPYCVALGSMYLVSKRIAGWQAGAIPAEGVVALKEVDVEVGGVKKKGSNF